MQEGNQVGTALAKGRVELLDFTAQILFLTGVIS
jgi:hypothetical protein